MAGISIGSVSISVVPSAEGFSDQLKASLVPEADAIGVEVGNHIADGIRAQLKDITVTVTADTAEATAALDELSRKNITPSVTFDDSRIVAALEGISAKLDELNDTTANIRVALEDTGITDRLDEISAKLDEIGDKDARPKLSLDDGDFNAQLDKDMAKLEAAGSGGGSGILSAIPGGGMTAGIVGAAAASPSFPGALTGAATGLGTLGLAYEGISGALSAYSTQSDKATKSTAQTASSALSSANTIRTAQQAVSQAETTQQHDAVTSAEAIKTAQAGVAQAVQQAAQNQISAEQQLSTAEYNEQQAQISLTQARQQAVLTLQQLNDASQDAVLNAKQASLDLQQAQLNEQTTNASSTSTALQKAQASLAVQEAQQRLIEANQSQTNSAKAANTANKEGVNGLPAVVSAEHAVATAKQATATAQTNLKNVTQAGATSIAKAEQTLADASRSASWQQQADAKSVADAQASLKNAYAASAIAAKGSAGAANTYQQALAKLSPTQQGMVKEIVGLEGALKTLENVADTAIAPGLSKFLTGLDKLLPVISPEISKMGGIIGGFLADMGKAAGTSSFQKMLETLFDEGNKFVQIVGPALGQLITSFMEMGAKSAPAVTGLANGLAGIANGLGGMFKALTPSAGAIGKVLSDIGQIVAMVGPPIGALLGAIVTAAEPIVTALLPPLKTILAALTPVISALGKAVGQILGQAMKDLAPTLASTAKQVGQLLIAMIPLLPPITQLTLLFLELAMKALGPLLSLIMKVSGYATDMVTWILNIINAGVKWLDNVNNIKQVFSGLWSWLSGTFGPDIANFFTKTIPGWLSTAIGLWKSVFITPWENGLSAVWQACSNFGTSIDNFFLKTLPGYWTSSIGFLKSTFVTPFQNALKGAWTWVTSNVWDPLKTFMTSTLPGYFSTAVSAIGKAFGGIENAVQTPVKWVVNNVIDRLISAFDWVSSKVGGPNIPQFKFAAGGMVPGGYGGGDVVPALLEPGEAVVNKVTTRAHAAELSQWGVPGFANGGLVPGSMAGRAAQAAGPSSSGNSGAALGPLSGAIGKIEDAVGVMSALATGNGTALTNDLMKAIGSGNGGAVADLAATLSGMTKNLVSNAVKTLLGLGGGGLGANGSAIVKYAESFIGKLPYVWGGTSLSTGADCSGFVQSVYKHFGIDAPRTSEQQWDWVKKGSPTPGGLAFFAGSDGTASSPGHVGIVIDSKHMVDEYTTGTDAMINSIQGSSGAISGYGTPPGGLAAGAASGGSTSANEAALKAAAAKKGWTGAQWAALNAVEMREAGYKLNAKNASSGAYGMAQFISGPSEYAQYGGNATTAAGQALAMVNYIAQRYKTPEAAEQHEQTYGWYDSGGYMPPGMSLAINGTGRPEPVFTGRQWDTLSAAVAGGDGAGLGGRSDRHLRRIGDLLEQAPERTGAHVGRALNGTARGAVQRAYSRTR